ncbi:6-phosphogluconate dehydrogenase (decarboxylating) [Candidatus Curtissbacteria bacterium RIFCSPHIGHO2_01_FULL_41_11]|uniref:6-phosphogluconate dehydrogenase (Decarboxylating) n=1 Tax=Candidatus Curtissbacteria bacterium RIFCSPHIGHO2_01_FULL_41_11 TaxID=1797711 RepID=A0A1F5G542_9BACT|nr:MAG: 6-phosphogluconate dehydrogenase (decarboxylating) [Candidatus Curtissbacteria bacterium RIFCSPHIGHO2_01_FULL_41_11]
MKLGFIGFGRMGSRMVTKLLEEGHEVVVWNRSRDKIENLKSEIKNSEVSKRLDAADSVEILINKLSEPRVIWSMLPAGDVTEEILIGTVGGFAKPGDILIDGANSHFRDTQKRYEILKKNGILYLGIGVSGGVIAYERGYPLMVGGSREAYDKVKPILDSLAKPNGGHEYFGEGGAGHFVKMVHNAIEYGYMQAIGEGFGIMDKAPYNLDLVKVAKLYQKGTLLSGFMMDRTVESLASDPKLEKISGYIEDSGETRWAIEAAKEENTPVEVISDSLQFREKSREAEAVSGTFAARMVAALRYAFGRHEVRPSVPKGEEASKND